MTHGVLENQPTMAAEAYDELRRRNRRRVSLLADEDGAEDGEDNGEENRADDMDSETTEADNQEIVDDEDGTAPKPW